MLRATLGVTVVLGAFLLCSCGGKDANEDTIDLHEEGMLSLKKMAPEGIATAGDADSDEDERPGGRAKQPSAAPAPAPADDAQETAAEAPAEVEAAPPAGEAAKAANLQAVISWEFKASPGRRDRDNEDEEAQWNLAKGTYRDADPKGMVFTPETESPLASITGIAVPADSVDRIRVVMSAVQMDGDNETVGQPESITFKWIREADATDDGTEAWSEDRAVVLTARNPQYKQNYTAETEGLANWDGTITALALEAAGTAAGQNLVIQRVDLLSKP